MATNKNSRPRGLYQSSDRALDGFNPLYLESSFFLLNFFLKKSRELALDFLENQTWEKKLSLRALSRVGFNHPKNHGGEVEKKRAK